MSGRWITPPPALLTEDGSSIWSDDQYQASGGSPATPRHVYGPVYGQPNTYVLPNPYVTPNPYGSGYGGWSGSTIVPPYWTPGPEPVPARRLSALAIAGLSLALVILAGVALLVVVSR